MNVMELLNLEGRVVLVTGGAGKYGAYIAEALAEAGATVVIASRDMKKCEAGAEELRSRGLDVHPGQFDITDEETVKALRDRIIADHNKLDVLINNAVVHPSGVSSLVECWEKSMKANAAGLFLITRTFVDLMVKARHGNIINISSIYGIVGQDPRMYEGTGLESDDCGQYFFHKAGMISFTRYLATRYAQYQIRANCISPGGLFANQGEAFVESYSRRVPLGRMAGNDDIKGAVVYLASDASSYMTGQNLVLDGGWTAW